MIGLTERARRAADCMLQGAGILGKRSVSETFDEGRMQSRSNVGSRIKPQRSSNSSALRRPTAPKRKDYGISRHVSQVSKHGNSSLYLVTHWYMHAVRLCARACAHIDPRALQSSSRARRAPQLKGKRSQKSVRSGSDLQCSSTLLLTPAGGFGKLLGRRTL